MMVIVNAPWSFTQVWKIVKAWLDEKTKQKIQLFSKEATYEAILRHVDEDQIPDFLGGKNTSPLYDQKGPWSDYELVDGSKFGDLVGIKKKGQQHDPFIFTPEDLEALPNPLLKDPENSTRYC